jgi:nitroimidazol reductase NimA-like FMN-containing flavoprotein (pyridoxamine 5'-phosphate oxidase superfamily)
MLIQAMSNEECWAMLARNNIVRLACARENQPYIVPLRVDLDGQFLYGYTSLGRKVEWMRTNPLVCLECEELTTDRVWASVIVFGRYEELAHTPGNEDALRTADRLFQKHVMWWEPATVAPRGHGRPLPITFRIHIDSVTGRRTISEQALVGSDAASRKSGKPSWLTRWWGVVTGVRRGSTASVGD